MNSAEVMVHKIEISLADATRLGMTSSPSLAGIEQLLRRAFDSVRGPAGSHPLEAFFGIPADSWRLVDVHLVDDLLHLFVGRA